MALYCFAPVKLGSAAWLVQELLPGFRPAQTVTRLQCNHIHFFPNGNYSFFTNCLKFSLLQDCVSLLFLCAVTEMVTVKIPGRGYGYTVTV